MNIDTAKAAAPLASQIEALQSLITMIDVAISEKWPISTMKVTAPSVGASFPAGTVIDLLPVGVANDANSQMGLEQARVTYAEQLDVLISELEAM